MTDSDPFVRVDVPARFSGVRFDRALDELIPQRSRAQLQKLVRRGRVKLDGRRVVRSNFSLRGGEALIVHFPEERARLDLLHSEPRFAVVNKPPGIVTHRTDRVTDGTLADLLVEHFGPLPSIDSDNRPGIVHRLDRETSGVMVVAKTPNALDNLRNQFRTRSVEKRYVALVHGVPERGEFEVDLALDRVPGQRDLQHVDRDGRAAHTGFRVLESFGDCALLECRPTTGRRHQIRVHLHAVGHPVVADKLYRPRDAASVETLLAHHALHAESLAFAHPATRERVEFRAGLPAPLEHELTRLRANARP